MRIAGWSCGILTVLALGLIWVAWSMERYINPHPERVVGDYVEAAVWSGAVGATLTIWFAVLASRRR